MLRMTRNMSLPPRRRSLSASAASGRPSVRHATFGRRGIGVAYAASRKPAAEFMNATNSGQRAASRAEWCRIASSVAESFGLTVSLSLSPSGKADQYTGSAAPSVAARP